MAQTATLFDCTYTAQDGTIEDWTAGSTINVGSGANRYAAVLVSRTAGTQNPLAVSVGSDALTHRVAHSTGYFSALFFGPLTVTGTQTITGTTDGSGAASGGFRVTTVIIQADGALTFNGVTTLINAASGGASFTRTRSPSSDEDDVGWMLVTAFGGALTASEGAGTTQVGYSAGAGWAGRRTATSTTVDINMEATGAHDIQYVGFTLTEAAGGGSLVGAALTDSKLSGGGILLNGLRG